MKCFISSWPSGFAWIRFWPAPKGPGGCEGIQENLKIGDANFKLEEVYLGFGLEENVIAICFFGTTLISYNPSKYIKAIYAIGCSKLL